MGLLLDTCVLLWCAVDTPALSSRAARVLRDTDDPVYVSSVSIWEVILKAQMGRYNLRQSAGDLLKQATEDLNLHVLPFGEQAALMSARLPLLHRDPFDRMLICQAMVDGLTIITPDTAISQYPVMTLW